MSTPDDDAVAAGHSVDPAGWRELFDELMSLVAGRFGRVEPRRAAREFVLGLLSPVERKNCWWLAEQAGHGDPQAMQRLLRTAVWDADAVRDDLRSFVAALYRFKIHRTMSDLWIHKISYAARWYSLITPPSTFLR